MVTQGDPVTARRRERGAALVLVMWLVAAMAITVGGALALAREEVGLASSRLGEAKVYALGKGIARLAILDRASAKMGVDENGDPDPAGLARVFSAAYQVDGLQVTAKVYPASGFVSVAESDPEVWQELLAGLGGVDMATAGQLAEAIVATELKARAGVGSGPAGSFGYYYAKKAGRSSVYVEQLLNVEGMKRATYDRIRPIISPFDVGSGVDVEAAPPELQQIFGATEAATEGTNPQGLADLSGSNDTQGYYCVEIEVRLAPSERFTQRVWVESSGTDEFSAVRLARIGKPQQQKSGRKG